MMNRGDALLLLGMFAGLSLAAYDLAGSGGRGEKAALGSAVVATVNGQEIRRTDYERALDAVTGERRDGAADPALAQKVLDRLIDEELLLQRGLELGLLQRDPQVRSALVAAVLALYAARAEDAAAADPGDDELGAFLQHNRARFRLPERLRVQRVLAEGEQAQPGDPPDALLPQAKLRDYLGEAATTALGRPPVGGVWSAPTGRPSFLVVERTPGKDPALVEVRQQVLAEYIRQAGDRELRAMLDERRKAAVIRIADGPR